MKRKPEQDNATLGDAFANWPSPLKELTSGPMLNHVRVLSDYRPRLKFKNGLRLARSLRRKCPDGLEPVLLITEDKAAAGRVLKGSRHLAMVVVISLVEAGGEAFDSYVASCLGVPYELLQQVSQLDTPTVASLLRDRLDDRPESTAEALSVVLSGEQGWGRLLDFVRSLAEQDESVRRAIRSLASEMESGDDSRIGPVLRSIASCDPETRGLICDFLDHKASRDDRIEILRNLMAGPEGTQDGGRVFGENIEERLTHIERQALEFNRLYLGGNETLMKEFILENLWIVSMDHARIDPELQAHRGRLDFRIERYDGGCDIVEMKGPNEPLIYHDRKDGHGPPSSYNVGPKLSNALAQSLAYYSQAFLNPDAWTNYRTDESTRIFLLLGRTDNMEASDLRVLEAFRSRLRGIEIIAYDEIGERARRRVANIRECLAPQMPLIGAQEPETDP